MEWTKERIETLNSMLTSGETLQKCGEFFSMSREGIRQVRNKYLPHLDRDSTGQRVAQRKIKEERAKRRREQTFKKYGRETYRMDDALQRAQVETFRFKKHNAKWSGWEFVITMNDLEWPTHCPVLGVELDWFGEKSDRSPSFDRIDSNKGYIPGNVAIISLRANRLKNNGTADEHEKIAIWMKKTLTPDLSVVH